MFGVGAWDSYFEQIPRGCWFADPQTTFSSSESETTLGKDGLSIPILQTELTGYKATVVELSAESTPARLKEARFISWEYFHLQVTEYLTTSDSGSEDF